MPENEDFDRSYAVGYGKPPKNGQFDKGRSGNPKGRPKGSKNLATIVVQEGRQRVRVNGPKGSRTVTKNQAVVMQLGNQAAQGNLPAIRSYLSLVQIVEERAQDGRAVLELHEIDTIVMQNIVNRLQNMRLHSPEDDLGKGEAE